MIIKEQNNHNKSHCAYDCVCVCVCRTQKFMLFACLELQFGELAREKEKKCFRLWNVPKYL